MLFPSPSISLPGRAMRGVFGALAAVALAAAGTSVLAADRLVAQLDWLPSGDKAAFYVGAAQGFYAEEGLEVVIQTGRGSADALTKIATGAADVGSAGFSALLSAAAQNAIPVKAVYSYFTELPDSFLTVQGNGISTIKDMTGRKLGATALSSSRVLMPLVFETNGMKLSDVQLQTVDANVLASMLAAGRVDAISAFRTQSSLVESMLREQGKQMHVLPWSAFGLQSYGTVVVASDRLISQRPDVLRRFLKAFRKSVDHALANPDAAGAAVKKAAPEIDEKVATAQFRLAMPLIRNATSQRDGAGEFTPALVQESWKWVAKSENLPEGKLQPMSVVHRVAAR
ncbi:MAG: ABC transporter substrate-binding protein [Burkholderiaceae bacterium]|nr:ABC transporter substrate-binding protein [Burkholderiaceae bacterium]